jgi:hypothetical protein
MEANIANIANFLKVSAAIAVRELSDGVIELIFSDGSTRPATLEEIAEAKRLKLRDDINAERERREGLGLPYVFPDGQAGTIQMRTPTDFRNIAGLTTAATIVSMGNEPVTFAFTDAENVQHTLDASQMLALGLSVQQRVSELYAAAGAIKAALASANPDTFDITQGWPD